MSETQKTIKVWDIFVRVFHWTFAVAITLAWVSHEWRGVGRSWHEWLGYTALGLAILRIVWGFVGTKYARFSNFLHWPGHYVRYLGALLRGTEKRYVGHNPLGGLMIVALLITAIGTGVTGYYLTQYSAGPFGGDEEFLEELHELLSNLFLVLVPLHILGVIWESIRHKESLVKAMITGLKKAE